MLKRKEKILAAGRVSELECDTSNTGLRFCVDYKGDCSEYVYVYCTQREGCLGCNTINEITIMEKFTSRMNQISFVIYVYGAISEEELNYLGKTQSLTSF
jgi:hypothetical protein